MSSEGMVSIAAPIAAEQVAANFRAVAAQVEASARRVGRDPSEITIVGAAKTVSPERIQAAIAAGLKHVGENYVQEALKKYEVIGDSVTWHFIGHLQSNKAKIAVQLFNLIHSLDRLSLAEELSKRAIALGKVQKVLVQVNVGYEDTKSGIEPEKALDFIKEASKLEGIKICGLMTMPPYFDDPEQVRPYFRQIRELAEELQRASILGTDLNRVEISMGMSHDFGVAIEEGATIVRIGTAIFGPRP